MRPEDMLLPTPSGVCCKLGGFFVDPTRPVDKAVITHGHSDHARRGHGAALATQEAQAVLALRRDAGYQRPTYLHGAPDPLPRYYQSRGIQLGEVRNAREASKAELAGAVALCPPSVLQEVWTRRFPDPVACFASGW